VFCVWPITFTIFTTRTIAFICRASGKLAKLEDAIPRIFIRKVLRHCGHDSHIVFARIALKKWRISWDESGGGDGERERERDRERDGGQIAGRAARGEPGGRAGQSEANSRRIRGEFAENSRRIIYLFIYLVFKLLYYP
jgi:hypothetical protein